MYVMNGSNNKRREHGARETVENSDWFFYSTAFFFLIY